jgi:hypothetical protein
LEYATNKNTGLQLKQNSAIKFMIYLSNTIEAIKLRKKTQFMLIKGNVVDTFTFTPTLLTLHIMLAPPDISKCNLINFVSPEDMINLARWS